MKTPSTKKNDVEDDDKKKKKILKIGGMKRTSLSNRHAVTSTSSSPGRPSKDKKNALAITNRCKSLVTNNASNMVGIASQKTAVKANSKATQPAAAVPHDAPSNNNLHKDRTTLKKPSGTQSKESGDSSSIKLSVLELVRDFEEGQAKQQELHQHLPTQGPIRAQETRQRAKEEKAKATQDALKAAEGALEAERQKNALLQKAAIGNFAAWDQVGIYNENVALKAQLQATKHALKAEKQEHKSYLR